MEINLNQSTVPFNLEHTLCCGQLFRWNKLGDWWYGVVKDQVIKLRQNGEKLIVHSSEPPNQQFIENYLRLDDNLSSILSEFSKDKHIKEAVKRYRGLRLVRQEPWECLISYMCATYKSIPAITRMINNLSRCHGTKLTFDGYDFYTFPKPDTLAKTSSSECRSCGLGFRAERVLDTAKLVDSGELQLESLKNMSYVDAKSELLTLNGVGNKVADCVLLFSLEKLEAFPIDVWVKRAATTLYADHFDPDFINKIGNKSSLTNKEYATISSFGREYFGRYAGYAQEYLFHMLRTKKTR